MITATNCILKNVTIKGVRFIATPIVHPPASQESLKQAGFDPVSYLLTNPTVHRWVYGFREISTGRIVVKS